MGWLQPPSAAWAKTQTHIFLIVGFKSSFIHLPYSCVWSLLFSVMDMFRGRAVTRTTTRWVRLPPKCCCLTTLYTSYSNSSLRCDAMWFSQFCKLGSRHGYKHSPLHVALITSLKIWTVSIKSRSSLRLMLLSSGRGGACPAWRRTVEDRPASAYVWWITETSASRKTVSHGASKSSFLL